jgi:TolB-like protein
VSAGGLFGPSWLGACLATGCTWALPPAVDPGLVVTVLYFDNNTNDRELDVLGKGIADMMVTDLSGVDGLKVVEREKLQSLIEELKLQQSDYFDPATAGQLGSGLGATHAVSGALTEVSPQLRIDVRLLEVQSSQVSLSDKVVGARDQFFALQEQLSERLVTALGEKLVHPASSQTNRVDDLGVVLEYSKGLDQLDRGDFSAAERILAGVVDQAPGFGLAKQRHDEALAKVEAARQRRETLLGEDQKLLLANADAALTGEVTAISSARIDEWLAYRDLRGRILLTAADQLLTSPAFPPSLGKVVPTDQREAYASLMASFVENTRRLTADQRAWKAAGRKLPTFGDLPDEDEKRASKLGIDWAKILDPPDEVAVELASMACMGKLPSAFHGSGPTAAQLDPNIAAAVLAELDAALADVAVFQPAHHERQTMRLLAAYGDCLLALGRKDEAIRRWQEGLDRYPTSEEYSSLEERIKQNL